MLNAFSINDHERLSRLAAFGVCVLAAAACIWFGVRLLLLFLPHSEVAPHANNAEVSAAATPASMNSVAKWHVFGNPQSLNYAVAAAASNTALKLTLFGTLALPDPKDTRAIAIIADAQGAEHSYRLGDAIDARAKLAEVYADHVILDHEGAVETLALPRPEQHAAPSAQANRDGLAGSRSVAASQPPGYVASTAPGASAPLKNMSYVDPQEFARQIRPVFSGGKIVGADLTGADAALLGRVGLKSTDIVTAVNGTPLNGISNPQQLMDSLKNSASIQVTVQRDGKPATLTLNLR